MKSIRPLAILWILLPPLASHATQPDSATVVPSSEDEARRVAIDAVDVTIPERKIQFEHDENAFRQKLFRADPELLAQKYVASVRFQFPRETAPSRDVVRQLPKELQALLIYDAQAILLGLQFPGPVRYLRPHEYFAGLIANLPEDNKPALEALAFFTKDDEITPFSTTARTHDELRPHQGTFHIPALTAEDAQQRAETLIHLFDYGLTLPILKHLQALKLDEEAKLLEVENVAAKAQETIDAISKELEETQVMSAEVLTALTTQQRLLTIDLAGTKARMFAAAKMLTRGDLTQSRIEHIENIKITSEIEMAGLAERLRLLDEIIGQARQRLQVSKNMGNAKMQIASNTMSKRRLEQLIAKYVEAIDLLKPFPLVDDKVVIQPLQWTE